MAGACANKGAFAVEVGVESVDVEVETRSPSVDAESSFEPSSCKLGTAVLTQHHVEGLEDAASVKSLEDAQAKKVLESKRVRLARVVSIVSLVIEVIAAALGISIGSDVGSLSLIGFGMEALLDAVASVFVLWRFKAAKVREHQDAATAARFQEARDSRRERISGLGLGFTFMLTAVLLLISAALKYNEFDGASEQHGVQEKDSGAHVVLFLSIPMGFILGGLAMWKLYLGQVLSSQVLWKDGVCSVLGAALALVCAVSALIGEASDNPKATAKVDAVASSVIAVVLLVEGARTVWHNLPATWATEHRPLS